LNVVYRLIRRRNVGKSVRCHTYTNSRMALIVIGMAKTINRRIVGVYAMGNQSVSGLSESEIRQIRRLKGKIQQEAVTESISNSDAVMWAVQNELERRD